MNKRHVVIDCDPGVDDTLALCLAASRPELDIRAINPVAVSYTHLTLKEANDIIWDNKLNSLPIVDKNGTLKYFVFRKDYSDHKANPLELLDTHKRYICLLYTSRCV